MVRGQNRLPGGSGVKERIERLLARFGRSVTFCRADGSEVSSVGVLEPVTSKSLQAMQKEIPGAGVILPGQYLFLGKAGENLDAAAYLTAGGSKYLIRRWDSVFYRDQAVFVWALCVKGGEEEAWT